MTGRQYRKWKPAVDHPQADVEWQLAPYLAEVLVYQVEELAQNLRRALCGEQKLTEGWRVSQRDKWQVPLGVESLDVLAWNAPRTRYALAGIFIPPLRYASCLKC